MSDNRRSRDMSDDRDRDQDDDAPSFRRADRPPRDLDDDIEDDVDAGRRSRGRYQDDESDFEPQAAERSSARSGIARFILPVGGGLLAGGALLAGLSYFLAENGGTEAFLSPSAQTSAPPAVSPPMQAGMSPGIPAPALPSQQAAPSAPPRGTSPGLAAGFAQGTVMAPSDQPVPGAPAGPMLGAPPPQPPFGIATSSGLTGVPQPSPEIAVSQARPEEVRRLEERIERSEERARELQERLSEAASRIDRYRRSNEALLASIADLRAEMDVQDAAIAEFRRSLEARANQAPAALEPTAPAQAAAAPPRTPPVQIPIRLATFNTSTRLTLGFQSEPVYDVDQRGNDVRVRFLGGELPNLLGLPAQIRNVESVASAPGVLEIRVTDGVSVRHAQVGAQVSLSFFNRGVEPPATAGAVPRERRPGPEPAQQMQVSQPPAASQPAASQPVPPPVAAGPEPQAAAASQPAPAAAPVVAPVAASQPAPATQPARPEARSVLSDFRLRSVSRRAVLVETSAGDIHRVELGEALPNSTAIAQEVRRDGDEWVLVTSAGVLRP